MKPKIYPVIHHRDKKTTLEQIGLAMGGGADGAFLISHYDQDAEIIEIAGSMAKSTRNWPIGINLLSYSPLSALSTAIACRIPMVWGDRFGVDSNGVDASGIACIKLLSGSSEELHPIVFAGVAFKHQKYEPKPAEAARQAAANGFIPTTSGLKTGSAADLGKVKAMSAVSENLAIASGVTPENLKHYAPHCSHILVATGIAKNEYELDQSKLRELVQGAASCA